MTEFIKGYIKDAQISSDPMLLNAKEYRARTLDNLKQRLVATDFDLSCSISDIDNELSGIAEANCKSHINDSALTKNSIGELSFREFYLTFIILPIFITYGAYNYFDQSLRGLIVGLALQAIIGYIGLIKNKRISES